MITCLSRAPPNAVTKLKCELNQYPKFGMMWVRPDERVVVKCKATQKACTTENWCTNKYDTKDIGYKKATLIIINFNPTTDAGVLYCKDGRFGGHNSCNLTIGGKMCFAALMS